MVLQVDPAIMVPLELSAMRLLRTMSVSSQWKEAPAPWGEKALAEYSYSNFNSILASLRGL